MGVTFDDPTYFDEVERSLYNGVLSGMSFDGSLFHYVNPLESRGDHARKPWFECACCPPNIARLILSIGRYIATESNDQITINLPIGCEIDSAAGGRTLSVTGEFPWSGEVVVRSDRPQSVRYRRPGFANSSGQATYETIEVGSGRDASIELPIRPKLVRANPLITENIGKVAVMSGPLVYCLNGEDAVQGVGTFQIEPDAIFTQETHDDIRHQVTFRVRGRRRRTEWPDEPYLNRAPEWTDATAEMVPYFAWESTGPMQVWIRELD